MSESNVYMTYTSYKEFEFSLKVMATEYFETKTVSQSGILYRSLSFVPWCVGKVEVD